MGYRSFRSRIWEQCLLKKKQPIRSASLKICFAYILLYWVSKLWIVVDNHDFNIIRWKNRTKTRNRLIQNERLNIKKSLFCSDKEYQCPFEVILLHEWILPRSDQLFYIFYQKAKILCPICNCSVLYCILLIGAKRGKMPRGTIVRAIRKYKTHFIGPIVNHSQRPSWNNSQNITKRFWINRLEPGCKLQPLDPWTSLPYPWQ